MKVANEHKRCKTFLMQATPPADLIAINLLFFIDLQKYRGGT